MKCDFCDENEATGFDSDWDAMLCDECVEAQRLYLESFSFEVEE